MTITSQTIPSQISMYEYLLECKEHQVATWGQWRDAQGLDDVAKQLVDEVYNEYICSLDRLLETLVPF